MKDIAIFGAGGFGREVLTIIKAINKESPTYNMVGFFDDGLLAGNVVNGYPVLGGKEELNKWKHNLSLVIAVGNPIVKAKIVNGLCNDNLSFPALIHPSVIIGNLDYVDIGKGCIICAGCIITTNIQIKDFVILNLGCTVGHDTVIGEYSSFMPSVNISGEIDVAERVYVGTGAKIINQLSIGENTIIGAGAVVINSLPSNCTVVGVPASIVKKNA